MPLPPQSNNPTNVPEEAGGALSPTAMVHAYLMSQGQGLTGENIRRVLEANAAQPGIIPGLSNSPPPPALDPRSSMSQAMNNNMSSGAPAMQSAQTMPVPPIPPTSSMLSPASDRRQQAMSSMQDSVPLQPQTQSTPGFSAQSAITNAPVGSTITSPFSGGITGIPPLDALLAAIGASNPLPPAQAQQQIDAPQLPTPPRSGIGVAASTQPSMPQQVSDPNMLNNQQLPPWWNWSARAQQRHPQRK